MMNQWLLLVLAICLAGQTTQIFMSIGYKMALLNRISNLLKKSGSNHAVSGFTASNASLFQAIRSMSSSKLFVGGISFQTDEMSLREAFSQYGEVVETRLILDRETGRSRGFGFVTYASTEAASSAIQALDGQDLHGRRIRVNYATERTRSPGFGGGFGGANYGQGGYQGGGYPAGDGNYGGPSGGYGGGYQYRRGGDDYGSPAGGFGGNFGGGYGGTDAPSVGGGSYTGGDPVQGGDNFGSGGSSYFSGSPTGFASSLSDGPTGADGELHEPVADLQDGTGPEGFHYDMAEVKNREDDVPNDYANTRI